MAELSRLSLLTAGLIVAAGPAEADPVDRWTPQINEASSRFGIPAEWIRRVMRAESQGQTMRNGRPITSRAGALGLMQLMPATWSEVQAALGLGEDPFEPRDNILAGTFYLRSMYDRFGYPGLFAAYNAGPSRYAAFLRAGVPLPGETRAYAATLSGAPVKRSAQLARRTPLFAWTPSVGGSSSLKRQPIDAGLFVSLSGGR